MGKGKLAKFADMARMDRVFEFPIKYLEGNSEDAPASSPKEATPPPPIAPAEDTPPTHTAPAAATPPPPAKRLILPDCPLRGHWHEQVFRNNNPIVLELGCGRGEYTVGLARLHPGINFIGIDIKGARMWTGAREAERDNLANVAFLRTNIEIIDHFFAPGEVSELWLTFSDPQMKKVTKRLTGTSFIQRYRRFLKPGGIIHLKTDSNFLFTYTEEMLRANSITPIVSTRDLYGETASRQQPTTPPIDENPHATSHLNGAPHGDAPLLTAARAIQTYYEQMWRERGIPIKYLAFALQPTPTPLIEPEVEIPLDEYRSYNRSKRSGSDTHT